MEKLTFILMIAGFAGPAVATALGIIAAIVEDARRG